MNDYGEDMSQADWDSIKKPTKIVVGMYGCDSGCEYLWLLDADGDEVLGLGFDYEVPKTHEARLTEVRNTLPNLTIQEGDVE